ncbi:hypothetical protein [Streptomyces sp. NPDC008001]|uniref:hypothetical protein n=1 Tax=Streptomyces sp. NPDC008001 TaxID=3364804 RepID=UPI0036E8C00D
MSTYRSRFAGIATGCALALALSATGAAATAPAAPAAAVRPKPPKQYTAAQVHGFLTKFYGRHGPTPYDRTHSVSAELRKKAAATKGYDALTCAGGTPKSITVGKVTTEPSGMGWAPVTTRPKTGQDKHFTAYVGLKGGMPMKLYDVTCGE